MAWIESHQELKDHPKTRRLARAMGWNVYETIGRLHAFWWWCVDYALDGDLRKYSDADIAEAVGLDASQGKLFVEAMVNCGSEAVSGFIERKPYFRVHDWFNYVKKFLHTKYKEKTHEVVRIEQLYDGKHNRVVTARYSRGIRAAPNLTKPNITNYSCAEPTKPAAAPPDKNAIIFPTAGKPTAWELPESLVEEISGAYPAIDVRLEAKRALVWVNANPARKKTAGGMPRFLMAWVARAQNMGGKNLPDLPPPAKPEKPTARIVVKCDCGHSWGTLQDKFGCYECPGCGNRFDYKDGD